MLWSHFCSFYLGVDVCETQLLFWSFFHYQCCLVFDTLVVFCYCGVIVCVMLCCFGHCFNYGDVVHVMLFVVVVVSITVLLFVQYTCHFGHYFYFFSVLFTALLFHFFIFGVVLCVMFLLFWSFFDFCVVFSVTLLLLCSLF